MTDEQIERVARAIRPLIDQRPLVDACSTAIRQIMAEKIAIVAIEAIYAEAIEDAAPSWRSEDHLPTNPDARPAENDIAGWCRFYAWGYEDEYGNALPWGTGQGGYGGGCQDCTFLEAADEIDRLNATIRKLAVKP